MTKTDRLYISRDAFNMYRDMLQRIRDHCSRQVGDAIDMLDWSTPKKIRLNKPHLVFALQEAIGTHAEMYVEAVLRFGNLSTAGASAAAAEEMALLDTTAFEAAPRIDTEALKSTVDYNAKKLSIGDYQGFKDDICGHAAMYSKRVAFDQLGRGFAISSELTPQQARTKSKNRGIQIAWVPSGDTCAFCIALASRGWQWARYERFGDYADHVHGHCDCELVFRANPNMEIEGYDPQMYRDIYYNTDILPPKYQNVPPEDVPWQERINAIRRNQYAQPRIGDRIREQHREQYAETHPHDNEGI